MESSMRHHSYGGEATEDIRLISQMLISWALKIFPFKTLNQSKNNDHTQNKSDNESKGHHGNVVNSIAGK